MRYHLLLNGLEVYIHPDNDARCLWNIFSRDEVKIEANGKVAQGFDGSQYVASVVTTAKSAVKITCGSTVLIYEEEA